MTEYDEAIAKAATAKIEEIKLLVQEYIHITDDSTGPGILTGGVMLFESTTFDGDGHSIYRNDFFTFPGTSHSQALGLVTMTDKDITHRIFGHCGDGA